MTLFGQNDISDQEAIKAVLNKQESDWNRGDINAFMEGYWKSKKLQFIGAEGVTYGWEQTKSNYLKGYPNKEMLGELTFDIISIEKIGPHSAMLVGQWKLLRKKDKPSGHFLLIWKKIEGQWRIVADHTSVRKKKAQ